MKKTVKQNAGDRLLCLTSLIYQTAHRAKADQEDIMSDEDWRESRKHLWTPIDPILWNEVKETIDQGAQELI